MTIVDRALAFATMAHEGQFRRYTGEPYIRHPIAVRDIVATVSDDEAMLAAALLHDVCEDCPVTRSDIAGEFGYVVACIVEDLTDISKPSDGNRETRKAIDRAHSARACPGAQTIKVADLIDNTKSIVQHDPGFAVQYMREKRLLLDVLTESDPRLREVAERQLREYEGATL